jgi:hypothetical protein
MSFVRATRGGKTVLGHFRDGFHDPCRAVRYGIIGKISTNVQRFLPPAKL